MRAFARAVKRAQIQLLLAVLALAIMELAQGTATTIPDLQLTAWNQQNVEPQGLNACDSQTDDVSATCLSGAVSDFNRARAAEGLGPMSLPSNYATLNAAQQLLVLANLDRLARGLTPISGLSQALNNDTTSYSQNGGDPAFPSYAREGGSNWASTVNPLWSEFLWVYDDGAGSPNAECSTANPGGCWGHRRNILSAWDSPIIMGASAGANGNAELILGLDNVDQVDGLSWAAELKYFSTPPGGTTTAPPKPVNVSAATGDGSATVRWSIPSTNVTHFVINIGGQNHTAAATARSLRVTGLHNGISYRATIRAYNQTKVSATVTTAPFVPAGRPGRPATPSAAVGGHYVTLSWPAAAARGSAIRYYVVHLGTRTWRTSARSIRVSVAPGIRSFTINAVNAIGAGPRSPSRTVNVR